MEDEKQINVQHNIVVYGGRVYIILIIIAIILAFKCNKNISNKIISIIFAMLCPIFFIFYHLFGNDCIGTCDLSSNSYDGSSIFIVHS